jgi:hypothetical protein
MLSDNALCKPPEQQPPKATPDWHFGLVRTRLSQDASTVFPTEQNELVLLHRPLGI